MIFIIFALKKTKKSSLLFIASMKSILPAILLLFAFNWAIGQSFDAELLNYEKNVVYNKGKLSTTHSFVIQINNKSGLDYADIQIEKSNFTTIDHIEAQIVNKNNEVVKKLKKKDILLLQEFEEYGFYTDFFYYNFSLLFYEFPYQIHYSYESTKTEFLTLFEWYPGLYRNIPTRNAKLSLQVPADYEIFIKEKNIQHEETTDAASGDKVYKWTESEIKPVKTENYTNLDKSAVKNVHVYPKEFNYGIPGSYESWQSFGDFFWQLNQGLDKLPDSEKYKVDDLLRNVSNDSVKIRLLYKYLQNETRYVNISLGIGGLKPHPAEYVSEKKYGDSKALSNYYISLLRYAGIESNYAIITGGRATESVDTTTPNDPFNHAIVLIPGEKDSLWVDCTSDFDCGYVGTFIQDRYALVIDKGKSYLKKTPALTASEIATSRNIYIRKNENDNAIVKSRISFKGTEFEKLFYIKKAFETDKKLEILQDYFVEANLKSPDEIILQTVTDNNEIILDYKTTSSTFLQIVNEEMLLKIPKIDFPDFEKPKARKTEVHFSYPINKTDQIVFEKERNNKITYAPKAVDLVTDFGEYHFMFSENDKHIMVNKIFVIHSGTIGLDEYEAFTTFLNEAKKADSQLFFTLSQ